MRIWASLCLFVLAACAGGGGDESLPFRVSGSTPDAGDAEAQFDSALIVVFDRPADPATLTRENIRVEEADGTSISIQLSLQGFNASSVGILPFTDLRQNVRHSIFLSNGIRSSDGARLKSQEICFVTRSVTPTVRPDQIIDLGDALNVPRYLAKSIRLRDGRVLIIGGYTDGENATDTLEMYDPSSRTFRLLSAKLTVPRAEHTATLLNDGRVIIAGGVSQAGGEPLASVDIFSAGSETIGAGNPMLEARRWHGASGFQNGSTVMVSGGFDASGAEKDTIEYLSGGFWRLLNKTLPVPTAQGFQINANFDEIYFSASNLRGIGAIYDGSELTARDEGDVRFRSAFARVGTNQYLLIGGDTRSLRTYIFDTNIAWGSTQFLRERRGAHSVTPRGLGGRRLLVVGGFNIARQGRPPLANMEIVDALDPGPFGFPDARTYFVQNVTLPVPFAGHVGFLDIGGPTVIAGGWNEGGGPHSRRAMLILDNISTPTVDCR